MPLRNETKTVYVGNLKIGGNNPIVIQSMTTTRTKETEKTIAEIKRLEDAGCELIRVAVLDKEDAKAIKIIKDSINIPLCADIHYDYELALLSIKNGADKIRLNPGNLRNIEEIKEVVNLCKEKNIPIRIGVNSGSLPKDTPHTAEGMLECAKSHIRILEELNFYDIILSLKASELNLAIDAYLLSSKHFSYPLHIGITESGTEYSGAIKSAIGIGILLREGLGNTIRVSLNGDKVNEIKAAKEILKNFNLINDTPKIVCCPTCGRSMYPLISSAAKEIEDFLNTVKADIKVAVMGCSVNGPGEAKNCDLGIAYGKIDALIFKDGKILRKVDFTSSIDELKKEIMNLVKNK